MPLFNKSKLTLEVLKGLIVFCKKEGIPHFKYKDFEFILSMPNPNQEQLEALTKQVKELAAVVNQLTFKEKMQPPSVFNRGEALASRLAGKSNG